MSMEFDFPAAVDSGRVKPCAARIAEAAVGAVDIHPGDNIEVMRRFADASFDLIYVDPPFNTGVAQSRKRLRTVRDENGDRTGFQGKRYRTVYVDETGVRRFF